MIYKKINIFKCKSMPEMRKQQLKVMTTSLMRSFSRYRNSFNYVAATDKTESSAKYLRKN